MSTKTYTDAQGRTCRITTNGKWRHALAWHDLAAKEQVEFPYLDTLHMKGGASFLRAKGRVYDLSDVMHVTDLHGWHGWHGAVGSNAFHAVLFKVDAHGQWMTGEMYS